MSFNCRSTDIQVRRRQTNIFVEKHFFWIIETCVLLLWDKTYAWGRNFCDLSNDFSSFQLIRQISIPCEGTAVCSGFTALSNVDRAIMISFRWVCSSNVVVFPLDHLQPNCLLGKGAKFPPKVFRHSNSTFCPTLSHTVTQCVIGFRHEWSTWSNVLIICITKSNQQVRVT